VRQRGAGVRHASPRSGEHERTLPTYPEDHGAERTAQRACKTPRCAHKHARTHAHARTNIHSHVIMDVQRRATRVSRPASQHVMTRRGRRKHDLAAGKGREHTHMGFSCRCTAMPTRCTGQSTVNVHCLDGRMASEWALREGDGHWHPRARQTRATASASGGR
jgi:hypothetical protein